MVQKTLAWFFDLSNGWNLGKQNFNMSFAIFFKKIKKVYNKVENKEGQAREPSLVGQRVLGLLSIGLGSQTPSLWLHVFFFIFFFLDLFLYFLTEMHYKKIMLNMIFKLFLKFSMVLK